MMQSRGVGEGREDLGPQEEDPQRGRDGKAPPPELVQRAPGMGEPGGTGERLHQIVCTPGRTEGHVSTMLGGRGALTQSCAWQRSSSERSHSPYK